MARPTPTLLDAFCCEGGASGVPGPSADGIHVMDECPHGDPKPGRCALCRQHVKELTQPWKYADTSAPQAHGVPKPIWFDAMVDEAREGSTSG